MTDQPPTVNDRLAAAEALAYNCEGYCAVCKDQIDDLIKSHIALIEAVRQWKREIDDANMAWR